MADPACPRCGPAERSATWTAGQDEGYEPKGRLSDPDLVEQRAVVIRGYQAVPDPGGDEHSCCLGEERDPGSLVGEDTVDAGPQLPGGGRVGLLRRLRLVGQLVGVRIAELGEVAGAGGILVKGAAAQDRAEEVRRGGKVCSPARAAHLDLAAGIAGRGVELVIGHMAHGGPVSQLPSTWTR